jgi:tRNA-modifying protein YgfZ
VFFLFTEFEDLIMKAIPAPEGDSDFGVPWHFGDPHKEQIALLAGTAAVDLSHWGVVTVTGPDRLTWLHSLTTAHMESLLPGVSITALVLSPHGHVEFEMHVVDDGYSTWLITPPHTAEDLVKYLDSMRFMLRVEVSDRSDEFGVVWEPIREIDPSYPTWLTTLEFAGLGSTESGSDRGGSADKYVVARPASFVGREVIVPRTEVQTRIEQFPERAGTWALHAIRAAAAVPQLGWETDHKTLPHEIGWIGTGVHLSKGCYRGQETVARVHNLGAPPRRLVLLHLDGSQHGLPVHGAPVQNADGKAIGFIATPARHYELGPIATAVIKRSTPVDEVLHVIDGDTVITASQEVVLAGKN